MRQLIILILCAVALTACGIKVPGVHRIPVQQGNYLEYKDVSQVKVGMSRDDVKAILGTPVVGALFNKSRWEYVYKLRTEKYGLFENLYTVYFEDDLVTRFESDIEPPKEEEVLEAEIVEPVDAAAEALEKAEEILEQGEQ